MRLVHPPLASCVQMEAWEYDSARFVYAPPRSVAEALAQADNSLEFKCENKDVLINSYLNGPRTLSNERLSYLIVGNVPAERTTVPPSPAATPLPSQERDEAFPSVPADDVQEFDLLICATHFLGDGMALHTFANELFRLIAGKDKDGCVRTTEAMEELLEQEWQTRWGAGKQEKRSSDVLPSSLEGALPPLDGGLRKAAARVDLKNREARDIVSRLPVLEQTAELTVTFPFRADTHSRGGSAQVGTRSSRRLLLTRKRQRPSSNDARKTVCRSRTPSSHSAHLHGAASRPRPKTKGSAGKSFLL